MKAIPITSLKGPNLEETSPWGGCPTSGILLKGCHTRRAVMRSSAEQGASAAIRQGHSFQLQDGAAASASKIHAVSGDGLLHHGSLLLCYIVLYYTILYCSIEKHERFCGSIDVKHCRASYEQRPIGFGS